MSLIRLLTEEEAMQDRAEDEAVDWVNDLGHEELLDMYQEILKDPENIWNFRASNNLDVNSNPYIITRAKEVQDHQQHLALKAQLRDQAHREAKQALFEQEQKEQAERENQPNWGAFT